MSGELVRYPPIVLLARWFGWSGAAFAATAFLPGIVTGFIRKRANNSFVFTLLFTIGACTVLAGTLVLHAQITQIVMSAITVICIGLRLLQHFLYGLGRSKASGDYDTHYTQLQEKRLLKSEERTRGGSIRRTYGRAKDLAVLEWGESDLSTFWKFAICLVAQLVALVMWAIFNWAQRNEPADPDAYETEFKWEIKTAAGFALTSFTVVILVGARIKELMIAQLHHHRAIKVHDVESHGASSTFKPEEYAPVLNPADILWYFFFFDNLFHLLSILAQLGDPAMTHKHVYLLYQIPLITLAVTPICMDTIVIFFGFYMLHYWQAHTHAGRMAHAAENAYHRDLVAQGYRKHAVLRGARPNEAPEALEYPSSSQHDQSGPSADKTDKTPSRDSELRGHRPRPKHPQDPEKNPYKVDSLGSEHGHRAPGTPTISEQEARPNVSQHKRPARGHRSARTRSAPSPSREHLIDGAEQSTSRQPSIRSQYGLANRWLAKNPPLESPRHGSARSSWRESTSRQQTESGRSSFHDNVRVAREWLHRNPDEHDSAKGNERAIGHPLRLSRTASSDALGGLHSGLRSDGRADRDFSLRKKRTGRRAGKSER